MDRRIEALKVLGGVALLVLCFVMFERGIAALAASGRISPDAGVKILFATHVGTLGPICAWLWRRVRSETRKPRVTFGHAKRAAAGKPVWTGETSTHFTMPPTRGRGRGAND